MGQGSGPTIFGSSNRRSENGFGLRYRSSRYTGYSFLPLALPKPFSERLLQRKWLGRRYRSSRYSGYSFLPLALPKPFSERLLQRKWLGRRPTSCFPFGKTGNLSFHERHSKKRSSGSGARHRPVNVRSISIALGQPCDVSIGKTELDNVNLFLAQTLYRQRSDTIRRGGDSVSGTLHGGNPTCTRCRRLSI